MSRAIRLAYSSSSSLLLVSEDFYLIKPAFPAGSFLWWLLCFLIFIFCFFLPLTNCFFEAVCFEFHYPLLLSISWSCDRVHLANVKKIHCWNFSLQIGRTVSSRKPHTFSPQTLLLFCTYSQKKFVSKGDTTCPD